MKSVFFLLFLPGIQAFTASTLSAERPNIVLFLVDDMGWMDSSPYGSQYYETPNMQRLAEQSIRLTDKNGRTKSWDFSGVTP